MSLPLAKCLGHFISMPDTSYNELLHSQASTKVPCGLLGHHLLTFFLLPMALRCFTCSFESVFGLSSTWFINLLSGWSCPWLLL